MEELFQVFERNLKMRIFLDHFQFRAYSSKLSMEQRKKTDKFDIKIGRIIPGLRTILFYFNNRNIILLKLLEDDYICY